MRKTVSQSDVVGYIKYAEKQILLLIGALISDKSQKKDAQSCVQYIFGETLRSYYGEDKSE